jgi:hypothetical protein
MKPCSVLRSLQRRLAHDRKDDVDHDIRITLQIEPHRRVELKHSVHRHRSEGVHPWGRSARHTSSDRCGALDRCYAQTRRAALARDLGKSCRRCGRDEPSATTNVFPMSAWKLPCTHELCRGGDLAAVRDTLGHESVSTTGRYLHARPDTSSDYSRSERTQVRRGRGAPTVVRYFRTDRSHPERLR